MKTAYYETEHYIHHHGNVVDLAAYRARLAAVSGDSFSAEHPSVTCDEPGDDPGPDLTLVEPKTSRAHRKHRRRAALSFWLDVCTSGAVLLFAIVAAFQFLQLF